MEEKLIPVKITTDDSGHWYAIPNHLYEQFNNDFDNEEFDDKYHQYRINGDLNNIQFYITTKTMENKELLIKNYIWDVKNDKPFDVFYEESPSTRLSLGWFNEDNTLTIKGEEQIKILIQNNKQWKN